MGSLLMALVLAGAGPSNGDTCCNQGKALPWADYNKGVRWSVGLSKDTERWETLAEKGMTFARESSLADRQAKFATLPKKGINPDWDKGLQAALDRARKEKKLVMFFQLVGDLDLEGC